MNTSRPMIHVFIALPPYGDHNDLPTREANTVAMEIWHRLAAAGFYPYLPYTPRPRELWIRHSKAWVDRCDCLLAIAIADVPTADMCGEIHAAWKAGKPVFRSVESLLAAYGMREEA